jgi:hypothetical protein
MKKFLLTIAILMCMFLFSSCTTYTTVPDDIYDEYVVDNTADVNINIIITYGTPYYYNDVLWYYYYNDLYYYPFYYGGYWYFRPYTRLYPWGYDFGFRPRPHDWRFRPGYYGFTKPHHNNNGRPHRPHGDNFDNHGNHHPNTGGVTPHRHDNRNHDGNGSTRVRPNRRHNDNGNVTPRNNGNNGTRVRPSRQPSNN